MRVILKPLISGRLEIASTQTKSAYADWEKKYNFGIIMTAITYNIGQKWAVTLCCEAEEKLELRVATIIEYLDKNYLLKQWTISDIDATGSYGNCLTARCNNEGIFQVSAADLLEVMGEEGQVIELDASSIADDEELFKILIRDGFSIDVLGSGEMMPLTVLGKYVYVDKELFMW